MKLHRNEKYIKWGLTAFLVFVACALFWIIFSNLSGFYRLISDFFSIIAPLLYGCVFAYLMNPIMEWTKKLCEKCLARRKTPLKPRTAQRLTLTVSVTVAVLVFLALLYAFIALVVPSLAESVEDLLQPEKLQSFYDKVNSWVDGFLNETGLYDWLNNNMDELLSKVTEMLMGINFGTLFSSVANSAYSVVSSVFNAVVGIIAAIYILIYKKQLCAQAKKITVAVFNAEHANCIFNVCRRANRIFSGFVIGKMLDALIVGVVTYIALLIMKMPYAPLIAVMVGVTNVIPFFGPFIGAIPSAILLLLDNPVNAVYFVIFTLILQMIDGYIIENRILGERLGISDLWVLAAVLIFGGIFDFGGMLLGVPIFAVIYFLIADAVNRRLGRKRYPLDTEVYYSLRCVEDLPVMPEPSYTHVSVEPAYDMNMEPEDDELFDEEE